MEELKGGFPGKVEVVVGDASGEEVSSLLLPSRENMWNAVTDISSLRLGFPESSIISDQCLLAP
jgi:hypothetical protein